MNIDNLILYYFRIASDHHYLCLKHTGYSNISYLCSDFEFGVIRDSYLISIYRTYLSAFKKMNDLIDVKKNSYNKNYKSTGFCLTKYGLPV